VKICSIIISQMKRITIIGLSTLFIVIALACFRVEPVSASIVQDSFNVPLSSLCDYTTSSSKAIWQDQNEVLGASDNITSYVLTTTASTSIQSMTCSFGISDSVWDIPDLPDGTVIDQVRFTLKGFTNHPDLNFRYYFSQYQVSHSIYEDSTLGTSNSFHYFDIFPSDLTSTNWNYLGNCLKKDDVYWGEFCNFNVLSGDSSNKSVDLDSIYLSAVYHYDDTVIQSRITAFDVIPIVSTTTPMLVSTGADILGEYYNSVDSVYTKLQIRLHNYFTNEDNYYYVNMNNDAVLTTYGISNFCDNVCPNGDTFQMSIRMVNDDLTQLSGYFNTYYYFAYNAYNPTLPATSTNPFSTTTSPFSTTTSTSTIGTLRNLLALSPTVEAVSVYCNLLHLSTFNPAGCIYYLIMPATVDEGGIDEIGIWIENIRNQSFGKIPFVGAFWTTTGVSLPSIDAIIPASLPGAGSRIQLGISSTTFDYILDAKASDSGFGTSTATFYETTSVWWNRFVYLMAGLYFLSRILSIMLFDTSGMIGNFSDRTYGKWNKYQALRSVKNMRSANKQYGVDVYKKFIDKNK